LAEDIAKEQFQTTLEQVQDRNGDIVFLNFIVYALGEQGIQPALGRDNWFWIKNPFIDSIGAAEALPSIKAQLERKFGVSIDLG
jgi:hypothetical protein